MYIKYGKINATVPKDVDINSITVEQAVEWIDAKAEKDGIKKPSVKKAAKKKVAKKSAAKKKKTATKKKAARKKAEE